MSNHMDHSPFDLEEDLKDFEGELKALKPRQASRNFLGNIDKAIGEKQKRFSWSWAVGSSLAAASLLLVIFNLNSDRQSPIVLPDHRYFSEPYSAQPVSTSDSWERTWDEGPILINNKMPVRKLLKQRMKTYKWIDKKRDIHIQIILPEQKVQHKRIEIY